MDTLEDDSSPKLSQNDLDETICNLMRSHDNNIPDSVNYEENVSMRMYTAWGVATTGVQIYNGLSVEIVDPFFPSKYADVRFPEDNVENVDQCLCHPQGAGTLHYHIASPCIVDATTWTD